MIYVIEKYCFLITGTSLGILAAMWWVLHEKFYDVEERQKHFRAKTEELSTGPFSLSSILVGIGILCLRMVGGNSGSIHTSDILIALFGFISVVAGALVVDSLMDEKLDLKLSQRLVFLNGGYLVFSIIMAAVSIALMADALDPTGKGYALYRPEPWIVGAAILAKSLTLRGDKGYALLTLLLGSVWGWSSCMIIKKTSYVQWELGGLLFTIVVLAMVLRKLGGTPAWLEKSWKPPKEC